MTSPSIAALRADRDDDPRRTVPAFAPGHGAARSFAGGDGGAPLGVEGWLGLAAAPTFALMALLTACLGSGRPDPLCSAGPAASPTGMMMMYALMGAFHSAAWLKLITGRRRRARRP